ncbi:hypothetical protein WDU94_007382 [Cyamophila willieti]
MSLFKALTTKKRAKRETFFKNEIIKQLNNAIHEIQISPYTPDKLTSNSATSALCTILEALFLHGLQETFLSKMVAMTTDMIQKPECNFWSIVLLFSHAEIISNINRLGWLTNDIGRCRAWLRLALNDNALVGYMDTMRKDPKSLRDVYKNTALLRDSEQMEIPYQVAGRPDELQLVGTINEEETSSEIVAQSNEIANPDPQDSNNLDRKPSSVENETMKPNVKPLNNLNKGDNTPLVGINLDALKSRLQVQAEAESCSLQPTTSSRRLSPPPASPIPDSYEGFEIVPSSFSPLDLPQFAYFTSCLTQLTREKGLKTQNYTCRQCYVPIGMNFSHHCWFTGDYFCSDCFGKSTSIIPARILFNWDSKERPVSSQSAQFLNDIYVHPVFNVKLLNPRLYLNVNKMTQVHYLRTKLNYIKLYLVSCKTTENYLHVELWPREYLYESLHTYSLLDLKEIHSGKLIQILNNVISYGIRHISSCHLCKVKGHLCELCRSNTNSPDSAVSCRDSTSYRSNEVIFPFDLERTYTCRECHATYHKECWRGECPKCERIRRRKRNSCSSDDEDIWSEMKRVLKRRGGNSELQKTSDGRDLIASESNALHPTSDVRQDSDIEVQNELSTVTHVRDGNKDDVIVSEKTGMAKHWTNQHGQLLEKRGKSPINRNRTAENVEQKSSISSRIPEKTLCDNTSTTSVKDKSVTSPDGDEAGAISECDISNSLKLKGDKIECRAEIHSTEIQNSR